MNKHTNTTNNKQIDNKKIVESGYGLGGTNLIRSSFNGGIGGTIVNSNYNSQTKIQTNKSKK